MSEPLSAAAAPVIAYREPPKPHDPRPPHPAVAALLCAPGVACWCALAAFAASLLLGVRLPQILQGPAVVLVWALAVVTGMSSIAVYIGQPKPWYVRLCLRLNVAGLTFTAGVLAFIAIAAMLW